jgi:hypothetical protein
VGDGGAGVGDGVEVSGGDGVSGGVGDGEGAAIGTTLTAPGVEK